jgi:hypothetical protein
MAKWRKVHIKTEEWFWTISKVDKHIVIKEPSGIFHTIHYREIDPSPTCNSNDRYFPEYKYSITPSKVKEYIERHLKCR